MTFIIHHEAAWKLACSKYGIKEVQTPTSWPVIASFIPPGSSDNVAIVNINMAAKLLTVSPPQELLKIDPTLHDSLVLIGSIMNTVNTTTPGGWVSATVKLPTTDPVSGEEGMVTVVEEPATTSSIPGLEALPMDPSKMNTKQNIADLGDPSEHVLDTERSI